MVTNRSSSLFSMKPAGHYDISFEKKDTLSAEQTRSRNNAYLSRKTPKGNELRDNKEWCSKIIFDVEKAKKEIIEERNLFLLSYDDNKINKLISEAKQLKEELESQNKYTRKIEFYTKEKNIEKKKKYVHLLKDSMKNYPDLNSRLENYQNTINTYNKYKGTDWLEKELDSKQIISLKLSMVEVLAQEEFRLSREGQPKTRNEVDSLGNIKIHSTKLINATYFPHKVEREDFFDRQAYNQACAQYLAANPHEDEEAVKNNVSKDDYFNKAAYENALKIMLKKKKELRKKIKAGRIKGLAEIGIGALWTFEDDLRLGNILIVRDQAYKIDGDNAYANITGDTPESYNFSAYDLEHLYSPKTYNAFHWFDTRERHLIDDEEKSLPSKQPQNHRSIPMDIDNYPHFILERNRALLNKLLRPTKLIQGFYDSYPNPFGITATICSVAKKRQAQGWKMALACPSFRKYLLSVESTADTDKNNYLEYLSQFTTYKTQFLLNKAYDNNALSIVNKKSERCSDYALNCAKQDFTHNLQALRAEALAIEKKQDSYSRFKILSSDMTKYKSNMKKGFAAGFAIATVVSLFVLLRALDVISFGLSLTLTIPLTLALPMVGALVAGSISYFSNPDSYKARAAVDATILAPQTLIANNESIVPASTSSSPIRNGNVVIPAIAVKPDKSHEETIVISSKTPSPASPGFTDSSGSASPVSSSQELSDNNKEEIQRVLKNTAQVDQEVDELIEAAAHANTQQNKMELPSVRLLDTEEALNIFSM